MYFLYVEGEKQNPYLLYKYVETWLANNHIFIIKSLKDILFSE